jgi:hypothetical protein
VPLDELLPAFVPVNMALGVSRSGLISTAGRIEAGTLGTDEGQAVYSAPESHAVFGDAREIRARCWMPLEITDDSHIEGSQGRGGI